MNESFGSHVKAIEKSDKIIYISKKVENMIGEKDKEIIISCARNLILMRFI